MRRLTALAALVLSLLAVAPAAAADRSFGQRFQTTARGDISQIGNTAVTCPTSDADCAAARNGTGTKANDEFNMAYVDVDGVPATFNSSTADLTLPVGATVLRAQLYWGGNSAAGTGGVAAPDANARGQVLLTTPTTARAPVTGAIDTDSTTPTRYQGYADVTSRVQGSGTYTVADVQTGTGANAFGGWVLVVAYRDTSQAVRQLTIYDGWQSVANGTPYSGTLTGIQTPATGTVNSRLGMVAWEGDRTLATGEGFTFSGTAVTNAANPSGNPFNSTNTRLATSVTPRNPAYVDQTGLDSDVFNTNGVLGNGQTSATVAFTSGQDRFHPGVFTVASDQAASAPSNTSAPAVTGTARDGQTLTVSNGSWDGTNPIDYAYQWQRCNPTCVNIAGATQSTYTLTPADVGAPVRARVTASNVVTSSTTDSAPTAAVGAAPPVNAMAPPVTGTATDGQTLTLGTGMWTGTPTITYARQWRRCDADGNGCVDIPGATGTTYTLTSADAGRRLRGVVTATNGGGSVAATSAPTALVGAVAPANTTVPEISGTARDGQTLTATNGSWSGTTPLTYTYQWRRCDPTGAGCVDIPGATGSTYTLTGNDTNGRVRVVVRAANSAGNATATSGPSAVVALQAPANTAAPVISGTPAAERTLSASTGEFTGTRPLAYAYQWQTCDSVGLNCTNLPGPSTGPTYALRPADVGNRIRVVVQATNPAGSSTGASTPSSAIGPAPPINGTRPATTGTPTDGQTLSVSDGTWTGAGPITYSYSWQRCRSSSSCETIPGANGRTYTLTDADVGLIVRGVVTATGQGGPRVQPAEGVGPVAGIAPVNQAAPPSPGSGAGGRLTADTGSWSGSGPLAFTYQWQRCDANGNSCAPIPGATSRTYDPTAADGGRVLRVVVTATNQAGSRSAVSGPVRVAASVGPPAGRPADDGYLDDLPGSLAGYRRCQLSATGSVLRRVRLPLVGRAALRVRSRSVVAPGTPLVIGYFGPRSKVRSVSYTLDGKRLGRGRGKGFRLKVAPSRLGRPGRHIFAFRIRARNGKLVRSKNVRVAVRTRRCASLLTGRRSETAKGQKLLARVDSTAPLRQVRFKVPRSLQPKLRRRGSAGTLRVVAQGQRRKSYRLRRGRGGVLLARGSGPRVVLRGSRMAVTGLPARAGIVAVELSGARGSRRFSRRMSASVIRTLAPRSQALRIKIRRR